MIQITYKGVDITDSVSISQCWHDMYAAGKTDTLRLRVNDTQHIWDAWAPAVGDEIRIDYGTISTGVMFLTSATPHNGTYDIEAQSAPESGFAPRSKAWQRVRLLQIGAEIASRNGLSFVSYGVSDQLYDYILQSGESDFHFLHRRAQLEGCAFLVYDKRLILYSERHMESQAPMELLDVSPATDYSYIDRRSELFGSCAVEAGVYRGEFTTSNGSARVLTPRSDFKVSSNGEAARFARNLLRAANKDCRNGWVRSRILPGYAAASMLLLQNERAPSWNGAVFIDHLRNDYGKGQSKIFFRKPLEGY